MISFELAAIVTQLHDSATRLAGTAALAAHAGAAQVLLFSRDPRTGVFFPAPGLSQAVPDPGRWHSLLQQACAGEARGILPGLDGAADTQAFALACASGDAILVFLDGVPSAPLRTALAALLPMLAATLVAERARLPPAGAPANAADADADPLNAALHLKRRELHEAYQRAERELVFRRAAEAKLRDADRRKDEFLAMLAHELRNPLAPIGMAAQILKIGPVNPVRLDQTCQIIERQVTHMTRLLDDLLDVSRVTGGMVALAQELHDMRTIVDNALEQARPLMNARSHHLTLDLTQEPAIVCGDGTRLVQIVTNLLNNASKYTPPGGDIRVVLSVADGQAVLSVRDSGIGISSILLPHVFDLFTQGERSPDRSQGGLGLGLALVESLVRRHAGTVEAQSAGIGKGSEFIVRLPIAADQDLRLPAPCEIEAAAAPAGPLAILIVDDNADAARTLGIFLQTLGHEVRIAFDGAGALDMASRQPPAVLLLDIGLPDMDGYVLAHSLRALPRMRNALTIALTGYGQPEDRARSREAGFDHHLTKPVDPAALVKILGSASTLGPLGQGQAVASSASRP